MSKRHKAGRAQVYIRMTANMRNRIDVMAKNWRPPLTRSEMARYLLEQALDAKEAKKG